MTQQVVQLPLTDIRPDPDQPRKRFDAEGLAVLSASIREHGVVEPILVRTSTSTAEHPEQYIVIAGERRYRACILAQLETVPAIVRDDFDAHEIEEVAITENVGRLNLNPMEEAKAFLKLRGRGLTDREIADRAGCPVGLIPRRIILLSLAWNLQEMIEKNQLGTDKGEVIAQLEPEDQQRAVRAVFNEGLTSLQFRAYIGKLLAAKAAVEIFTEEQVSTRSRQALDLHDRANKAYDLAIEAVNSLVQPGSSELLVQALGADAPAFLEKIKLLVSAYRWLDAEIKAAMAITNEKRPQ